LAGDHAAQRLRDVAVVSRQPDVGPDDRAGVAQPLGIDVAGRNVGRPVALRHDVARDRLVVRRQVDPVELGVERGAQRQAVAGTDRNGCCQRRQNDDCSRDQAAVIFSHGRTRPGTFP
jgi:hypothetical protein